MPTELSDGYVIYDFVFWTDHSFTHNMVRFQQRTLDLTVTCKPKQPLFITAGLLDYIVEMIVFEDKVSNVFRGINIH